MNVSVHIYIGQKFAMMEEKILLANFLRHFRIESVQKPQELHLVSDMTLRSASGIKIKIFSRNE